MFYSEIPCTAVDGGRLRRRVLGKSWALQPVGAASGLCHQRHECSTFNVQYYSVGTHLQNATSIHVGIHNPQVHCILCSARYYMLVFTFLQVLDMQEPVFPLDLEH